jgi:3-isopropylmalate/(R)-2-methylmalate dehydratase small subunit
MQAFRRHCGIAAPLLVDNIDTDQIIPSREMKRVSKLGLGEGLFAGWRYAAEDADSRTEDRAFVLNQERYRKASILLAGRNFGCGSSREHAVWALADFGIRAVIAESFGRIFRSNCARNGLLAITQPAENIAGIAAADGEVCIDLEAEVIVYAGGRFSFSIAPGDRKLLLLGLDYIDFTLTCSPDIDAFIKADRARRAWAYLNKGNSA